jgi:hypothetical protein
MKRHWLRVLSALGVVSIAIGCLAAARGFAGGAAEGGTQKKISLAFTVNNMGYTETCG